MPIALRRRLPEPVAAKVPEIGLLFWVIKLLTTFMGEVTSDFFGEHDVVLGAAAELAILLIALTWQFRTRRYSAPAYWGLAMAIAIFGTGVADAMHQALALPYAGTSLLWAAVLAAVFVVWYRSEGTLSIHSIVTTRRECLYWCTVFATFALGTALGDFTATSLNLGYAPSGLLFAGIFLLPAIAWKAGLDGTVAFWAAYVLTRPLGASFADYVSKGTGQSGIGFGNGHTALASGAVIVVLVAFLAVTGRGVQRPQSAVTAAAPRSQPRQAH